MKESKIKKFARKIKWAVEDAATSVYYGICGICETIKNWVLTIIFFPVIIATIYIIFDAICDAIGSESED